MMKRKKLDRTPRQYALVECLPYPEEKHRPFPKGQAFVFLGEIPNMPGHCIVAEAKKGKLHVGFHTDRFKEITEDKT